HPLPFSLIPPPPPTPTLFPYTTLFRSRAHGLDARPERAHRAARNLPRYLELLRGTMPKYLVLVPDDECNIQATILHDAGDVLSRSEEHTSELQSLTNLVCRLLLATKKH